VLDQCLGAFVDALDGSTHRDSTLLVIAGARGFPLGEHARVGPWEDCSGRDADEQEHPTLYTELLHVPWLVRLPGGVGAGGRTQALVQPIDLAPTLLDWWGLSGAPLAGAGRSLLPLVREESTAWRDRACAVSAAGERSIQTSAWRMRWGPPAADGPAALALASARGELFVKPDDYWEVNDVADRCPDVSGALVQAFESYVAAEEAGRGDVLPPLDPVLTAPP
jgi:arylsulfatase A-like enzyme